MKNVIVYFILVILVTCICYFGPIDNIDTTDYDTVLIQTYEVEILHLDVDTVSNTEKKYYASVMDKTNDFSVVVEITESRYTTLKTGDIVVLQKETFHNNKNEEIKYSIVSDSLTVEYVTMEVKIND